MNKGFFRFLEFFGFNTYTLTGNLFNEDWTKGNLFEIEGITNIFGPALCWVISVVGFFIVGFSIFKNAVSGLYCVFPNFFDKVDEIHQALFIEGGQTIGNAIASIPKSGAAGQKLGSMVSFILSHIPNVKSFTDFDGMEGSAIDKKQYFMRSLPLLVAQIFIGMLIFFGYPGQIANWIGTAGTKGIDIVLANVDPIETIKKASDTFASVDLATDNSEVPLDKVINGVSGEAASQLFSNYTKMKKNTRQTVASEIESIIQAKISKYSEVIGADEGYTVTYDAKYNTTRRAPLDGSGWVDKGDGVYMNTSSTGIISYRFWIQVPGLSTGMEVGENDNIMITIICTPQAVDITRFKSLQINATANSPITRDGKNGDTITFKLPSDLRYSQVKEDGWQLNGVQGRTASVSLAKVEGKSAKIVANGTGKISVKGDSEIVITSISWDKKDEAAKVGNKPILVIKISGWKVYVSKDNTSSSMSVSSFVINNGEAGVRVGKLKADNPATLVDIIKGKIKQTDVDKTTDNKTGK